MRLINTTTLELREFFDSEVPAYAILSHRWGPREVNYDEFLAGTHRSGAGYQKILDLCRLAREGILTPHRNCEPEITCFQWAWIDTICIDKRSSAELSEAINSMYHWYSQAGACLVFLPDATAVDHEASGEDYLKLEGHSGFLKKQFIDSVWFTRGWTLQELLAPDMVLFYDTDLRTLGWKRDEALRDCLALAAIDDES